MFDGDKEIVCNFFNGRKYNNSPIHARFEPCKAPTGRFHDIDSMTRVLKKSPTVIRHFIDGCEGTEEEQAIAREFHLQLLIWTEEAALLCSRNVRSVLVPTDLHIQKTLQSTSITSTLWIFQKV